MKTVAFSLLIMGAAAADAAECRYEARRDASVDAAGASALFVHGETGGLRVRAERSGGQLRVVADVPDSQGWNWRGAPSLARRDRYTCIRSHTTSAVTASEPAAPSDAPSAAARHPPTASFEQPN